MSPLYLTGIELAEFRSFSKLKIELAGAPGVLVVHGSNGLGKSSLFDALEWALTDGIDHFRDASGYKKVGTYLCRWRETLGPTSAALAFSDGSRIEREIASVQATSSSLTGSIGDITEFLRKPDWTQSITALNRYLLLTHFLGQSTLSRLTHRSADERFEILKEASQSAELEAFGIAMHGKGSNLAARAFTKRITDLERDAEGLRELLALEAELWTGAQASGAIDDAAAALIGQRIAAAFDRARIALAINAASPSPGSSDPAVLQAAIDAIEADRRERDLAITQARQLVEQQQRDTAARALAAAAVSDSEAAVSEASAATSRTVEEAAQLRAQASEALEALTAAKSAHSQLVELRQSRRNYDALHAARAEAERRVDAVRPTLAETERHLAALERRSQIVARLGDETRVLDASIETHRLTIHSAGQWLERTERIGALRRGLDVLDKQHPEIDQEVTAAQQAVDLARAASDLQATQLTAMQTSVGALSSAVALIAANLPAGSCECPACATRFTEAATLGARVNDAAARLAPLLVDQQDKARRAQDDLDAAVKRLEDLQTAQSQLRFQRVQLVAEQAQNDQLLERIGWTDGPSPAAVEARRSELERGVDASLARTRRRRRWIKLLAPDPTALATGRTEAARQRDDARRAEGAAIRLLDDATAQLTTAREVLDARQNILYPGRQAPHEQELESAIETALGKVQKAQATYDRLRGVLTQLEAQVAGLQASETGARTRHAQALEQASSAQAALNALAAQWQRLGWAPAGASQADLDSASQGLSEAGSALAEAQDLLKRLREGREAWTRQQTHRSAFERLLVEVDLAPYATRDQVRAMAQKVLATRERLARATREAKAIAALASAEIAKEVEEFNAAYIEPLDKLTKQINQAILCDPRVGIDLHIKKNKIEQSASRAGELPASLGQIDPILVHSEGQMAALAVSMLCAASLTYPWSRWRALILDDPLQHNDAIHAAAFADLIGNLVQKKNYQVLLSTHDLGQAEFLQRKFEARRIPCAVLNLLGRGKDGVEWTFKPAKAPALPSAASA